MKQIIVLMSFVFLFMQIQAQDASYKAEIKKILIVNNNSNYETIFMQTFEIAKDHLPYKTVEERNAAAQRYAKKYQETQALDDVCDVVASYYIKYLNLEEVQTINNTLDNNKYKGVYEKANSLFNNNAGVMASIYPYMLSAISAITSGNEPEPILDINEKRSGYYVKYQLYVDQCEANIIIKNVLNEISSVALSQTTDEKQKEVMKKVFDYIAIQLLDLQYVACKKMLSEDELDVLIELYKKPEFKKLTKTTNEISSNIMDIGTKQNAKIAKWLSEQNIE